MPETSSHKRCPRCKELNLPTEMSSTGYCHPCNRARVREWGKTARGKECSRANSKRYSQTEHGKKTRIEITKRYSAKHPEVVVAHNAVNNRVNKGTLQRPQSCSQCGHTADRIEAHHYKGYEPAYRLTVHWLCVACHKATHNTPSD